MFRAFDLRLDKDEFGDCFGYYEKIGAEILSTHKQTFSQNMIRSLKGNLSGTELQDALFSPANVHIFISHSHNDLSLARALAGWLKAELGVVAFVDSNVWGSADKLHMDLVKEACANRFILNKQAVCQIYGQHVHMMLAVAIQKMIDSTEVLFFLNTPNSISTKLPQGKGVRARTQSPWLYYEISCAEMARSKNIEEYRGKQIVNESLGIMRDIEYDVEMSRFMSIDVYTLIEWVDIFRENNEHPLDVLYRVCDA